MDVIQIMNIVLSVIGGATIAFRLLAPLTESKKDDKVLQVLETILRRVAFNKDEGTIKVRIN